MIPDKLHAMWEQQRQFMCLLQEKRGFPSFPVDITSKQGQKLLTEISHHCTDELHEARQHLKNAKSHRATEVTEIDLPKYKEELADALHLFIELCIVSGLTMDEIYEAYMEKGLVNVERIKNGY